MRGKDVKHTFVSRLKTVEPYLFNLADQLTNDYDTKKWNMVIGEDTSGRLPTYFVRRILHEASGKRPVTKFVVGSKAIEAHLGVETYADYFSMLQDQIDEPLRPLTVTESVGSGRSVQFLSDAFASVGIESDFATVVCKPGSENLVQYSGAESDQASWDVFHTFESTALDSLKGRVLWATRKNLPQIVKDVAPRKVKGIGVTPSSSLTGITVDIDSLIPVSKTYKSDRNVSWSYQAMEAAVQRYLLSRNNQ